MAQPYATVQGPGGYLCQLPEPAGHEAARPVDRQIGAEPPKTGRTRVRFLGDQKIRHTAHQSVQALEADVRAWIADWNINPRPLAWTDTQEIFEPLTRPCRGILGTEHR